MPIFVWWAVVAIGVGLSGRVLLDDKTVIQQVSQPIESIIDILERPVLLLGIGIMIFFILRGLSSVVREIKAKTPSHE